MKSARERAEEMWRGLPRTAQLAIKYEGVGQVRWTEAAELMFKEHARNQRHICCDEIMALDLCGDCPGAATFTRDDAYSAVLAAPAPGEKE